MKTFTFLDFAKMIDGAFNKNVRPPVTHDLFTITDAFSIELEERPGLACRLTYTGDGIQVRFVYSEPLLGQNHLDIAFIHDNLRVLFKFPLKGTECAERNNSVTLLYGHMLLTLKKA